MRGLSELSKLGYTRACRSIFAYGRVPCGPVGNSTEVVGFAYDPATGQVLRVHRHGCHSETVDARACVFGAISLLRNPNFSTVRKLRVVDPTARSHFNPNYKLV